MVLNRLFLGTLLVATGACKQSLFDNGGGDDITGDDDPRDGGMDMTIEVPATCPTPCLGDGAGDFNGSATGANQRWRYLDDNRDRTWTAMTAGATATGSASNKITTCAAGATGACTQLPQALLVSTSGDGAAADPALEYTAEANGVVQLSIRAFIPDDGRVQTVRVYRGSREDSLLTFTAQPGVLAEGAIVLDALANERFLVAIGGSAATSDIALEVFVSESTTATFPSQCQLAIDFEPASVSGTTVRNRCTTAGTLASRDDSGTSDVDIAPSLAAGPYTESGMAGDFVEGRHLDSQVTADRSGNSTTQFWWKFDAIVPGGDSIALSDMDLDNDDPGGVAIKMFESTATMMSVYTCIDGTTSTYEFSTAPWPAANQWHFVRVVQRGDKLFACIDGAKVLEVSSPVGTTASSYPFRIGRDSVWTPQASYFDGQVDDVRFLKGVALPCD